MWLQLSWRAGSVLVLASDRPLVGVTVVCFLMGRASMSDGIRKIKACGFLIVRGNPVREFLLMKHKDRLDLPKGHMEEGESEIETAWRELEEETGIGSNDIRLDSDFRFETSYDVWPKRFGGQQCRKTTVLFLGFAKQEDLEIRLTEHPAFEWRGWNPPHKIQKETIDPLLADVARHLESCSEA